MIEILIAIIALLWLSIWLYGKDNLDLKILTGLIAPIFIIVGFFGLVLYALLGWDYFAAGYKANIINKEFGTSYTQEQVFYASDVIDEIQNLKRKRVEINGDLMTGKKP